MGGNQTFDLLRHSLQSRDGFYLKRGNAENFIREEKYGYDLDTSLASLE